jgi:hypothetical protein
MRLALQKNEQKILGAPVSSVASAILISNKLVKLLLFTKQLICFFCFPSQVTDIFC